jgi:tRNA threonylcarbamoyladenosine biosynthesis protein TsaE
VVKSTFSTSSPEETEAIGAQIAAALRPGAVVLVRGELGAGKTTLVRGAARALGVQDPITSPTFTIGNRYRAGAGSGAGAGAGAKAEAAGVAGAGEGPGELRVAHLDLYRLADISAEDPDLLEDYLTAGDVVFIEWPERGAESLVRADVSVTLSHDGGERRVVELEDGTDRGQGAEGGPA